MTEKRFEATICHDYDMIHDILNDKYYDAFTVADILNQLLKENNKLSNALIKSIKSTLRVNQRKSG